MSILEQSLFRDGLLDESEMNQLFDIVIVTETDKIKKYLKQKHPTEVNIIDPELLNYPNMYLKHFITHLIELNSDLNTGYLKKLIKDKAISINFNIEDNNYDFKHHVLHFKKDDHYETTIFRQLFSALAPNINSISPALNSGISEILNEEYFIKTNDNEEYNDDFIRPFISNELFIAYCNDDLPGIINEINNQTKSDDGIELISLINLINKLINEKDNPLTKTGKYNMIAIAKKRIDLIIDKLEENKKLQ